MELGVIKSNLTWKKHQSPPWFSFLESLLLPSWKGQQLRETEEGQNESKECCFQEIGLSW